MRRLKGLSLPMAAICSVLGASKANAIEALDITSIRSGAAHSAKLNITPKVYEAVGDSDAWLSAENLSPYNIDTLRERRPVDSIPSTDDEPKGVLPHDAHDARVSSCSGYNSYRFVTKDTNAPTGTRISGPSFQTNANIACDNTHFKAWATRPINRNSWNESEETLVEGGQDIPLSDDGKTGIDITASLRQIKSNGRYEKPLDIPGLQATFYKQIEDTTMFAWALGEHYVDYGNQYSIGAGASREFAPILGGGSPTLSGYVGKDFGIFEDGAFGNIGASVTYELSVADARITGFLDMYVNEREPQSPNIVAGPEFRIPIPGMLGVEAYAYIDFNANPETGWDEPDYVAGGALVANF